MYEDDSDIHIYLNSKFSIKAFEYYWWTLLECSLFEFQYQTEQGFNQLNYLLLNLEELSIIWYYQKKSSNFLKFFSFKLKFA